ncbi:nucleolar protein 6 [Anoplophora glabripennis]|uniref:nucleolar protein 6 n=1 Tax=Anoplophora glabripennis TaxID=217634 RepID=UPI0008751E4F|nr:nucleolar protein 6 [Anoplophora glabripennis]
MEPEDDFEEESGSENDFTEEETSVEYESQHSNGKKRSHEDMSLDKVSRSPQKRKKEEKPPSVQEIRNWKETENLYSNSLFRLQIEELVSEIKIKNKRHKNITSWLKSFQSTLEQLPDYTILLSNIKMMKRRKISDEEKLLNKLSGYHQFFKCDQDVTLKFTKPESFEKFGLYENNSLPGPDLLLNINLVMPKDCFIVKDFLNNRYFCKRYYYLLYVAENLKSHNIATNVTIDFHELNSLLPVLKVEPTDCDKTIVTIYASPSEDTFKMIRFLPETNNIKQDVFNTNLDSEVLRNSPTSLYNSALAHDVTLSANNKFIQQTLADQNNVQEAVKLLCIWLRQREFNVGIGSFTEDLILYFITYLFSKNKINKYMSSYQVVRNLWNFIGTSDLENNPISISDLSKNVLDVFKKHFQVVCLDVTGYYNVAAFLNMDIYKKIKLECQWAIKCLNDNRSNSFQLLFLRKLPFYLQYDLVIDLSESLPLNDKYDIKDADKVKYIGYKHLLIVDYISRIFQRALSKRVLHFVPRLEVDGENMLNRFLFGVNLNPEEAFSFMEVGPALNDHVAAADFRKFWGHLSSDRRFRDGSTNVAVYFRTNTVKGKRNIIKKILNFVTTEKLNLKNKVYYDEFDEVLISKKLVPSYPSGTNEETCLRIIQASDELGKRLRALQMSLKITGIQGVSDVYNFTELFPPIPANYEVRHSLTTIRNNNIVFLEKNPECVPRFVQPVKCVLLLEHSSKWPNNLQALRHIKTSFYLEISKNLQTTHNILSHVTSDFIDIYFEGIVLRYSLYIPKEVALIKKEITETGLTCYTESQDSLKMENNLNVLPKVVGALKGVQSMYPSYGPGTALIKRWLRSQLIDSFYFPDIVINLLNASLYLNDAFPQSNTPQISFLRFLKFFVEFDWNLQIVLVNFNDDLSKEDLTELEAKIQENREQFPPLYIVTPFDRGLSVFTQHTPSKEILYRVKELAKVSIEFVHKIIMERNYVGIKELFIPNFNGYNVLIHLKSAINSRRLEQIVFANVENRTIVEKYKQSDADKLPIVDFSPVEKYLSTLRENYGKYAMFFHDSYGGNTIGVLWNPKVFEKVDFKVSRVNAGMAEDDKITFNLEAVIEDFYILGNGLIKMIDKR